MKIAYCFVGHARTYRRTHVNFFRNVFSLAPGDVYIHTWSEASSSYPAWWKTTMKPEEMAIASRPVNVEEIARIYKPKKMMVEHQRSLLPVPSRSHLPYPAYSLKVVYESAKKAFNMAKEGKYDRYFMTRMDINYLTRMDVKEYGVDRLFVPPMKALLEDLGAASDLWVHGSEKHVETSTDYFWEIDRRVFQNPDPNLYHEQIWDAYMKEKGVPIAVSRTNFEVSRMFGGATRWEPSYDYRA